MGICVHVTVTAGVQHRLARISALVDEAHVAESALVSNLHEKGKHQSNAFTRTIRQSRHTFLKSLESTEFNSPLGELSIMSKSVGNDWQRLKHRRQPWQTSNTRRISCQKFKIRQFLGSCARACASAVRHLVESRWIIIVRRCPLHGVPKRRLK
jgi:hypothetical protein